MSSDVIADMLSQIKNAVMVNKEYVEISHSKMRESILEVMASSKFIESYKVFKEKGASHKSLHVDLAYDENGNSVIRNIKRVSKPGRRIYQQSKDIRKINPKYGLLVISTPKGIMSGEEARKNNLGGEVICEVA